MNKKYMINQANNMLMTRIKKIKLLANNQGTVLLVTLLVLTSILTISLAAASLVTPGIVINRTQQGSVKAYFAAEAGAERFLWDTRKNPSFIIPNFNQADIYGTVNLTSGSFYNVDFGTSTPIIYAISTGGYLNTKRTVYLSF